MIWAFVGFLGYSVAIFMFGYFMALRDTLKAPTTIATSDSKKWREQ